MPQRRSFRWNRGDEKLLKNWRLTTPDIIGIGLYRPGPPGSGMVDDFILAGKAVLAEDRLFSPPT